MDPSPDIMTNFRIQWHRMEQATVNTLDTGTGYDLMLIIQTRCSYVYYRVVLLQQTLTLM